MDRAAPFILTAELPPDILAWANGLRRTHYPPERNFLPAHVTLFHAFAPSLRAEILALAPRIAGRFAAPRARLDGVMPLGRGTALAISSPQMLGIRACIADHFHGSLTAQDKHPPRLHITVQNKVSIQEAKALQERLIQQISPREFTFFGLALHLYLGGPWERLAQWKFRGKEVVDQ